MVLELIHDVVDDSERSFDMNVSVEQLVESSRSFLVQIGVSGVQVRSWPTNMHKIVIAHIW